MRNGLILALCASALACGKPLEPATSTINVKTLGAAGGTLVGQGPIAGAEVVVPFGALAQDTPISLGADPEPPDDPPGWQPASFALITSPEGLQLLKPATLVIPYTGLSNVQLFTAEAIPGRPWEAFDGGAPDTSQNVLRASVGHFSRWRVFRFVGNLGPPPDAGTPDAG